MNEQYKEKLAKAVKLVLIVLAVFIALKAIGEFKNLNSTPSANAATITVSGEGEIYAVPDIAQITYTIRANAGSAKDAAAAEAKISKAANDAVKSAGVDEKDIKTDSYNSYPQYSNTNIQPEIYCIRAPCPQPTKQSIVAYEVTETVSVKVRNTDDTAKVLDAISKAGVKEVSGPDFTIDDPQKLQDEARAKAIVDAKAKAKVLERQLGVHLGKVVSFSENGNYPMYYAKESMAGNVAMDSVASSAPTLAPGQDKITSNITITYEIR